MRSEGQEPSERWIAQMSFFIVCAASFLTRLMPLHMSQYPFNNDSITECGIASEILASGSLDVGEDFLWLGTHALSAPFFNILIAFFSALTGTPPLACAQIIVAVISVVIVGAFFNLGSLISGNLRGGLVAAMIALMMGTFVFTTGSAWKTSLGLCMLSLALVAYVYRGRTEYRALLFVLLLSITFSHHVVAALAYLLLGFALTWSWLFAITRRVVRKHLLLDTFVVVVPGVASIIYYDLVALDRLSVVSSGMALAMVLLGYIVLSLISMLILTERPHLKWTTAPVVGVGLLAVVLADYLGYIFPYTSSASPLILLLFLSTAFLVSLAWYGTEVMLDGRSVFRALQVMLLLAPMAFMGIGVVDGLSPFSHQVSYRTFDYFDPFIFLGVGVGMVSLYKRRRRLYILCSVLLMAALTLSFPFAYASESLLGIRHDTQGYELDAIYWLDERCEVLSLVSDERIAFVASNTVGLAKNPTLPAQLVSGEPFIHYQYVYLMEDRWTTEGVNSYPDGELLVSELRFDSVLDTGDVFYVGGPYGDALVMFMSSTIGANTVIDSDD